MKREDLELRAAARAGDSRASLEMARRLFDGACGLPRNPKLGLAYVQQELAQGNAAACELVASRVPLELLAAQQLIEVLRRAGAGGCAAAAAKLGAWELLASDDGESPQSVARRLAALSRDLLDPLELALVMAEMALVDARPRTAARCLHVASELGGKERLAQLVWRLLSRPSGGDEVQLPVALVESSLRMLAADGHAQAQRALGRVLAGLPAEGPGLCIAPRKPDRDRAQGWLLRAADGGEPEAWLDLYSLAGSGNAAKDQEKAARFYLQKAAAAGVPAACLELGKVLLREANSLAQAEEAVHWLARAREAGLDRAAALLETLVASMPPIDPDDEASLLERIGSLDRDIGMRCELARAFHLTRHEALALSAPRDLRAWGLVLHGSANENPKGRVAPATDARMQQALARARAFYSAHSQWSGSLVLQRGRLQRRIFALLGLQEEHFFVPAAGRSLKQPGYGRHWAASRRAPAAALAA